MVDENGIVGQCTPSERYWYHATCVNVVDGDTIDIRTDLGFKIYFDQRVRLFGINTPELNSKDPEVRAKAELARDLVAAKILKQPIIINSHKDKTEKFGRYLATVFYTTDSGLTWFNLNEQLVAVGLAVEAHY